MIYYGPNKMEYWYRSIQPRVREFKRYTESPDVHVLKKEVFDSETWARSKIESDWKEQTFGLAGAAIAGTIYSLSYPITLVDGPLPFVDAAWAVGLFRVTKAGYDAGEFIGSLL